MEKVIVRQHPVVVGPKPEKSRWVAVVEERRPVSKFGYDESSTRFSRSVRLLQCW